MNGCPSPETAKKGINEKLQNEGLVKYSKR